MSVEFPSKKRGPSPSPGFTSGSDPHGSACSPASGEARASTLQALHAVTGRCACGRVRYRCLVESRAALCSCDLCRRSSGSAFQGWVNGRRSSLVASGDLKRWASTLHATRHFCGQCGSTLFLLERDEPEVVEVAAGSIDGPDGITSGRPSETYIEKLPAWSRLVT